MRQIVLLTALLILISSPVSAEQTEGKDIVIKGRNELDAGRYAEAVENLNEAYKRLPVIGDYILLWQAKAQKELGDIEGSNAKIKELFKHYPDSPLRKKARNMELKNILASQDKLKQTDDSDDKTAPRLNLQAFESYVKDYPEDFEMKFLYARLLNEHGNVDKAKTLFKNIYIKSENLFSKLSQNELSPSDITLQDMIEKASNLMDFMEYAMAESLLRKALLKDDGQRKHEILKKLGHSLFKQKRYKESAEIYEKAGDHYSKARALYRIGEKTAFEDVIKKLVSMDDRRTGVLLLLAASDKRRDGQIDEAVCLYKDIKTKYPSEAENSLWGIGWTYYLNGDYQNALDVFSGLSKTYGSSRYLYWEAQSLEKIGRDAAHIYKQLSGKEPDFYSVISKVKKSMQPAASPASIEPAEADSQQSLADDGQGSEPGENAPITENQNLKLKAFSSERVDILMALGLKNEAAAELTSMANKTSNPDELLSISLRLNDAGEYRSAINFISRLPYREHNHSILYPRAHWAFVTEASDRYGVDPFIILSIIREESRFDPDAHSQAGALGLMQLMPQTAYSIDKTVNLGIRSHEQLYNIQVSIALGSYYIHTLIREFKSLPAAIAAYNAGEEIVRKWLKAGNYKSNEEFIEDIPYDETRNFTKRVITTYFEYFKYAEGKRLPKML